jgi:hypothetical protein
MPIRCPKCGMKHDVARFTSEGGRAGGQLKCSCGFLLDLSLMETVDDFLRFFESEEELKKAAQIQEDAQAICQMILSEDCSDVDIEIAKEKLKEKVRDYFPDKMETYHIIYEARFKRIWEQFRHPGQ